MKSRRKEKRSHIMKPVYFFEEEIAKNFAVSINLSRSGMCIITSLEVTPGQEVTVYSKFLWPDPRKAIATWSRNLGPGVNKAGFTLCPTQGL